MESVSSTRPITPSTPQGADGFDPVALAHSIAAPILQGLAALYELGQRCSGLEAALADDLEGTLPEAAVVVAAVRKVADLCAVGARGCVIDGVAEEVAAAMRMTVDTIGRVASLAVRTDGHEAWSLVPV